MYRIKVLSAVVKNMGLLVLLLMVVVALSAAAPEAWAKKMVVPIEEARIFIEYNSTDNDLGFHVFLDHEDWKTFKIVNPNGRTIFDVAGKGPYQDLGLSELAVEGAEPTLDDFPLSILLSLFPEGEYDYEGVTVEGVKIEGEATLTHAVPAGPDVSPSDDMVSGNTLNICWNKVDSKPPDPSPGEEFPVDDINVVAYQVIVDSFQVTLPATGATTQCATVTPEFVDSLGSGTHGFEVLAIEEGGNQTITAGSFTK